MAGVVISKIGVNDALNVYKGDSSKTPWTGVGVDPNTSSSADTSTLKGTVSDILGLQSTAATDKAAAAAATTQAAGYTAEAGAYGNAADIATQNAIIANVAGDIKSYQQQRAVTMTLGEQQAQTAAAGFGASGSSLDILLSSLQQGYLTQQLTATQTSLTAGGYLEEAAASQAEKEAAKATAAAATATSASYTTAGSLATANAAAATAALNKFIGTGTLTTAEKLILAPLSNTTGIADVSAIAATETLSESTRGMAAWEQAGRRLGPLYNEQAKFQNEQGAIEAQKIKDLQWPY